MVQHHHEAKGAEEHTLPCHSPLSTAGVPLKKGLSSDILQFLGVISQPNRSRDTGGATM